MGVERLEAMLKDGNGRSGNADAGRLDGQVIPPFASHVQVTVPESQRQEFHSFGIVNAKSGDDEGSEPAALRFEANIGSIEMKSGEQLIEGQSG
jgi:hypothetical protein